MDRECDIGAPFWYLLTAKQWLWTVLPLPHNQFNYCLLLSSAPGTVVMLLLVPEGGLELTLLGVIYGSQLMVRPLWLCRSLCNGPSCCMISCDSW